MSSQQIKVSIDGGVTFHVPTGPIKVVYPDVDIGDEKTGTLEVTLTNEGIVKDVWSNDPESVDTLGTSSDSLDMIICELID